MTNEAHQPSLSHRLDDLRPLATPSLPSFELIERNIRRVLDRYDAPDKPPERDAERLFSEMLRRIREHDWHKVPMSFVTRVASLVYAAAHRFRDDLADIRRFLCAEIRATTRHGFINPMVRIYIESYETGKAHTLELAEALQHSRSRIGARWQPLLENVPELLDAHHAPSALAAKMDLMPDPWHGLRALGLHQPHAPGLMDTAHIEFLNIIEPQLTSLNDIERLLGWLKPDDRALRQVGAGKAIEILLGHWRTRSPPAEIQSLLVDRLTQLYSHPRVNPHPAWNEVDPALVQIFLRWLMGADIRFLFRVLTEVERGHMWADREKFWWTLHEQGRIDEVWIAFNDDGHRAALSKLPTDVRQNGRRFGRQVGDRDKSLLVMRIRNKIVVEGTFNFKVHFFKADQPRTPELYRSRYDVADIRNLPNLDAIAHLGDWQSRVLMALSR
ncbi:hypothetical protein LB566_25010 [Mesorhizobium sp. CA13]|uniref:EH signature domain-containing protein n=1 Tax=Mesorhizobium sp. CA13 TaxID=2876643 RepID=UPI001CCB737F|nr:EH signature domain-containing protein [Mesorhizobium sp. CA13]MBZ9857056.1 hypothetical protein [Mesorhizobium sp. CA13]